MDKKHLPKEDRKLLEKIRKMQKGLYKDLYKEYEIPGLESELEEKEPED